MSRPAAPMATYRLQLRPGFGFDEVAALTDYLDALGVTHVYLSPHLQAAPGSSHGYDVVGHDRVNAELGGARARARMVQALQDRGLGQVVDVVPNHMAITTPDNRWWWDVLENGPASRFAAHFDVDWRGHEARLHDTVLMPILGDHFGRVLESGQLRIRREGGRFELRVYDEHVLPLSPRSMRSLLRRAAAGCGSELLFFLADCLGELPSPSTVDLASAGRRQRDKDVLQRLLTRLIHEEPEVATAVDQSIAEVQQDPNLLGQLLEEQNYRLAYWRMARHDLDYRRFFDIDSLVGLRMEREQVFEDTHALILSWVEAGEVDGLRIDHPDGLRDPLAYLQRLRDRAPRAWIGVEKILSAGEQLPESWPVDGTTGYDFMHLLTGLFVDPRGEATLRGLYDDFTGTAHPPFEALVRDKKRLVLDELLASDLNRLTQLLVDVCEARPRYRDYSREELRGALRELIAWMPVYRTYLRETGAPSAADRVAVQTAIAGVRSVHPAFDANLVDLLEAMLEGRDDGSRERGFVARLQQLCAATMAKGEEDTAFYCDHLLIARNEVGGDPAHFGVSVATFHEHCARIARLHPATMLASSTHDSKRSEDVRARIALLSEVPERWAEHVRHWSRLAQRHRRGALPDREMEYLLYQTLVGAWPIDAERLVGYFEKAAREAKVHTSWLRQDAKYESALGEFVRAVVGDAELTHAVQQLVDELDEPARRSALSQVTLKLTAPGVPDIYQGNEVWRHDLTDPDNRRPVDFPALRDTLTKAATMSAGQVWRDADRDLQKLWLTRALLKLRASRPGAFAPGSDYAPLRVRGAHAEHVVAFARGGGEVITIVPRLLLRLGGGPLQARVSLPPGRYRDALTSAQVAGPELAVGPLLAAFPVAVLSRA